MPAGAFGETVADLILKIIADVTQYEEALKQADRALEKSVKIGEKLTERYAQNTENAFKRVTRAMYVADKAVNTLTARLNKMGLVLAGVAAASFVPYTAALIKVREENQRVELMFWKLNEAMNTFSNVLAEMILPHANEFAEIMQKIADRFQSLNPAIKKTVIGLTILRAKILLGVAAINWLFAGIIKVIWVSAKWIAKLLILRFIFRTIFGLLNLKVMTVLIAGFIFVLAKLGFWIGLLIGKLLLLPVVLIKLTAAAIVGLTIKLWLLVKAIAIGLAGAIAAFVSALWGLIIAAGPLGLLSAAFMIFVVWWIGGWGKIRETTRTVVEWLQNTLNSFLSGFHEWVIGFQVQLFKIQRMWEELKTHGIKNWKLAWEHASKDAEGFRVHLKSSTDAIIVEFGDFLDNFEEQIEELKEKIREGIEALFQDVPEPPEWMAGFELGLLKMIKELEDWGEFAKQKAIEIATSMQQSFSNFFFDAFMGQLDTIQDYMASFGRTMLRIIADVIARLMVLIIFQKLAGIFAKVPISSTAVTTHEGGLIPIAHEGMAPGERMIRAQVGEGILSRNGVATLGIDKLDNLNAGESVGGGLNVNLVQVIRAWGPEDVYRERKMLASAMISELERNGLFRKAIKKFT